MKTRFDLEQEILGCWNLVDEVKLVSDSVMDRELDQDTIANILTGLNQLYQIKFENMFNTFEDLIHARKIT